MAGGRYVKHGDVEEWVWDDMPDPTPEVEPVTTAAASPKPTARKSPAKKATAKKSAAKKR